MVRQACDSVVDMEITFDDLRAWTGFILPFASMIYAYIVTRRKDVDAKFENVRAQFKTGSDRMDRHEGRIARLEQTVSGLPSKEDIHSIELHMTRMSGTMERMEAVMEGNQKIMSRLETIVTRHEDHLLTGAKQ